MAPSGKRKRGDRTYSQDSNDGSNRPSPHRPGNLNLAHQNQHGQQTQQNQQNQQNHGRGFRRSSRGGRGGGAPPQSPATGSPGQSGWQNRSQQTPKTNMSPPPSTQSQNRASSSANPVPPETAPTPASQPSAPARPSQPSNPKERARHCEYLTDDRLSAWHSSGKRSMLEAIQQALTTNGIVAASTAFQELVRAGLDGHLSPEEAGTAIKDILQAFTPDTRADATSHFLDCISILAEAEAASPSLRAIMFASGVDPSLMREDLETPVLAGLGLVRDTFQRIGIRKATDMLYRQSNYNLLREETEGYSKLITEYFTTSNSGPPTGELAAETFQRVKALIGAFDLDVGRVLDVTLDVFANLLVKHYRFFIKLLRVSSWWPEAGVDEEASPADRLASSLPSWALPNSEGWQTSDEEKGLLATAKEERDNEFWIRAREIGTRAFFELGQRSNANASAKADLVNGLDSTKTGVDPNFTQGNRTAAQLLGFKLRFYASPARDVHDTLPDNLIHLAALLIKIGFISLQDLYPHLYPPDESMPAVKEKLMKEKAERERKNRPGGGINALMMAGALADDTIPPPAMSRLRDAEANRATPAKADVHADKENPSNKPEAEVVALPEPADQKIQLLKSLLCIGAIPEALFILGRFPWLVDAYPDLPEYIHRILHHCLNKVYEPLRPLRDRPTVRAEKQSLADQGNTGKGEVRFADFQARRVLRWANLDKNDAGDGIDYRFYWDDWADHVPVCQNIDDVFTLCSTLLNFSGVKIGQDPELLMKLARIGKKSLTDDYTESNINRWIDLAKRLLVPALSLTKANPGVVNEMYELLKFFSARARYTIYAEWYTGQISRLPDIQTAFNLARAETKDVLKRISKTNTKPMARALAKVAYASPGIVFSVALNQIEAYENLIEVVVECARYFTYLGYDVLTWSLMNSLGGRGRDRVQADGMLTSSWLKALSLFAGRVFKRYSVMLPSSILQYVANQLRMGISTDLEVLEQIIASMAGIRSDISFNEAQTQAMAGGDVLRAQTLEQLHDKRHETKQSSKRLLKSLTDPPLVGRLLIAIAQERQTYVFHASESDAPLKVLGNNLDKIHQVFIQYLEMLRSNLSVKDFDALVPDVVSLMSDFGLDSSIAFAISQPSIAHAITEMSAAMKVEKQDKARAVPAEKQQPVADVSAKVEEANKTAEASAVVGDVTMTENENKQAKEDEDVDMKDAPATSDGSTPPTSTSVAGTNGAEEPWATVLNPLIERFKAVFPASFEEDISLSFYLTFWQLSLRDMLVPSASYEEEIKRQRDKISAINADRSDITAIGVKKKEQKKKELNELQDRLRMEMKTQIHTYSQVRGRLQKEKERWFSSFPPARREALNAAIMQECFLPRILLSSLDALYTFKMLFFLHSSGTPGFGTMHMIDRLFREKQFTALLFQSTAREAENLGRFYNELLKELRRWHIDSAVYEKVAYGPKRDLPGFVRKPRTESTTDVFLGFEDFRRLHYKWHRQFTLSIKACLTSGEYMHIRNAIIVLKAVHQHFPMVNWTGQQIVASVTALSKTEVRGDLKLAATSLLGDLRRREKEWVLPQAFYIPDPTSGGAKGGSRAPSAKSDTPQPNSAPAPTLSAAAPEFKPKPSTLVNGSSKAPTASKTEVEDGEIDDAKLEIERAKQAAVSSAGREPVTEGKKKDVQEPGRSDVSAANLMKDHNAVKSGPPSVAAQEPRVENKLPNAVTSTLPPHLPPQPSEAAKVSSTPTVPARPTHNLPNRPEPQPPHGRMLNRMSDRATNNRGHDYPPSDQGQQHDYSNYESSAAGQNSRDPNGMNYGRLDRPGTAMRDQWGGRHEQSPGHRSRARTPDRVPAADKERREPNWTSGREARDYQDDRSLRAPPRDARYGGRNAPWPNNDRAGPATPGIGPPGDARNHLPPGPSAGPSSAGSAHYADRVSNNNSERPPFTNQQFERPGFESTPFDRQTSGHDRAMGNRERAGPSENDFGRRQENMRLERDNRRDWNMPEPGHRTEGAPSGFPFQPENARDDRRHDRGPMTDRPPATADYSLHGRTSRDEPTNNPPSGPRLERPHRMERPDFPDNAQPPRSRELFQHSFQPRAPPDPNEGRLSQDSMPAPRPNQAESYGRLNSGPDIPSGPRGRTSGGRGGRNFTAPPISTRGDGVHAQSPLMSPQANDNSFFAPPRDRQGSGAMHADHGPPTPSSAFPPTPNDQSPPDMGGIHPSRLNRIQASPVLPNAPGPLPSHAPSPAPAPAPSITPMGPRGTPRSGPGTPAQSPMTRFPPTGQLPVPERRPEDKRFAGIQNMLQQGGMRNSHDRGDRGASIRGRAGQAGNGTSMPPPGHGQPPAPAFNRPDGLPPRVDNSIAEPPARAQGVQDMPVQDERVDTRSERRDGRREGERRSGRPRQSRSQSRDQERDGSRRDEERGGRNEEHRERRGGSDREGREPRRGHDGSRNRERDRDRERRDGRSRNEENQRREPFVQRDDSMRRAGPPPPDQQQQQTHQANWENRSDEAWTGTPGSDNKRDERDWRERRDGRDGRDRGDFRKRGRAGEDGGYGENKRPRRTN